MPLAGVVMGSKSDTEAVQPTLDILTELSIDHEVNVISAHRTPEKAKQYAQQARDRGIEDGQEIRVWNDMGEFFVPAKVAPNAMPGQVIVYNGWEPYMFRGWRGPMDLEPGMVKWLHLAGGYGHLRYWPLQWQPTPIDRAVRVDIERAV